MTDKAPDLSPVERWRKIDDEEAGADFDLIGSMVPDAHGDWVRASDYDALAARVDALTKERDRARQFARRPSKVDHDRVLIVEKELRQTGLIEAANTINRAYYENINIGNTSSKLLGMLEKAEAELATALARLGAVQRETLEKVVREMESNWGHVATPEMRDAVRAIPLDPDAAAALERHDELVIAGAWDRVAKAVEKHKDRISMDAITDISAAILTRGQKEST